MNKLETVITETFNLLSVNEESEIIFQDLESWDSLTHMNFVVAVEQTFNIELTSEEIIEMQSYFKTKDILEKKGVNVI